MRFFYLFLAMLLLPTSAQAWERARELSYPGTIDCLSENMCLVVSCPVRGQPSFEMLVYEHGKAVGEKFDIRVDGRTFEFTLPERGENDLYRWPLAPEFAQALATGKGGQLAFDPEGLPHQLRLRGSGNAISKILASCDASTAVVPAAATKRLSGLSPEVGCQVATTTGRVVDVQKARGGNAIQGFRFKDKYGVAFINVDPPKNRKATQARLVQIIVPGAKLKVTVHGCGASASIEVLAAVEVVD